MKTNSKVFLLDSINAFIVLSDILALRSKTGGPLSFIQLDNGLKFDKDEKPVSRLIKMT